MAQQCCVFHCRLDVECDGLIPFQLQHGRVRPTWNEEAVQKNAC